MSAIRDRLKQLREYRGLSQQEVGSWLGMNQRAYGRKEKDKNDNGVDGWAPEEFEVLLGRTRIDARWLFGQLGDIPIQKADLDISTQTDDVTQVSELLTEYKRVKEQYDKRDKIAERLQSDQELRECVEMMIAHRGHLQRIMGYVEAMADTGWSRKKKDEESFADRITRFLANHPDFSDEVREAFLQSIHEQERESGDDTERR